MTANRSVYLDHQATTPVDERVLAAMLPFFNEVFGNPHSTDHSFGREAASAIATARAEVADLIGAEAREVIFTSGATEANNLLIKGAAAAVAAKGRPGVITCSTEHKAVLEVVERLAGTGTPVTVLGVLPSGLIDLAALEAALGPEIGLVSVMAVNNEIGVEQPLAEIGALCRRHGALFHTDAAQAVGKVPLAIQALKVDLLSLSAHKMYGPKGIGAAFVRRAVRPMLAPLFDGGGQEGGLRGGTLPTPLCVALGAACRIARDAMSAERAGLETLRDRLLVQLADAGVSFEINGDLQRRWPGNLNLSFEGVDAEALMMSVGDRLALSSGSACTAQSLEPSHVIVALGYGVDRAEEAVRIGFGRSTRPDEVDRAAAILTDAVRRLRGVRRVAVAGG